MRFASIFLLILLCVSSAVWATAPITPPHLTQYCQRARSTADVMACITKQHETAERKLGTLFEKIIAAQEPEKLEEVRAIQKDWITYRDRECDWQTAQASTESLKRLTALSCLTTLTENRAAMLSPDSPAANENTAAYALPRWMNVVASEKPRVFWQYNNHISADVDCDDKAEEIMIGLDYQNGADSGKSVIAITNNPTTGRPQTTVLPLGGAACATDTKLIFSVGESAPENQDKCTASLHVQNANCDPVLVFWNGHTYQALPIPPESVSK